MVEEEKAIMEEILCHQQLETEIQGPHSPLRLWISRKLYSTYTVISKCYCNFRDAVGGAQPQAASARTSWVRGRLLSTIIYPA